MASMMSKPVPKPKGKPAPKPKAKDGMDDPYFARLERESQARMQAAAAAPPPGKPKPHMMSSPKRIGRGAVDDAIRFMGPGDKGGKKPKKK